MEIPERRTDDGRLAQRRGPAGRTDGQIDLQNNGWMMQLFRRPNCFSYRCAPDLFLIRRRKVAVDTCTQAARNATESIVFAIEVARNTWGRTGGRTAGRTGRTDGRTDGRKDAGWADSQLDGKRKHI